MPNEGEALEPRAEPVRDDGHAFDIPHQRKAQPLNTPCLISHRLIWHEDLDIPRYNHVWKGRPFTGKYARPNMKSDIITDGCKRRQSSAAIHINQILDDIQKLPTIAPSALYEISFDTRFTDKQPFETFLEHEAAAQKLKKSGKANSRDDIILSGFPYYKTVYTNRTLSVSGYLYGIYFEISINIHSEYHTITIRAFPLHRKTDAQDGTAPAAHWRCANKVEKCLRELSEDRARTERASEPSALDLIFEEFWSEFRDKIYQGVEFQPEASHDAEPEHRTRFFGTNEAVFQGVILRNFDAEEQRARNAQPTSEADPGHPNSKCWIIDSVPPARPRSANIQKLRSIRNHPLDEDNILIEAGNRLNKPIYRRLEAHINAHSWFFSPFFGFGAEPAWVNDTRPTNSVMSTLSSGLAIYGSDLGAHDQNAHTGPNRKTRFFIVYGGNSRDQLGRMTRLLLQCAEMRIVALKRYSLLKKSQNRIEKMIEHYEKIYTISSNNNDQIKLRDEFEKAEENLSAFLQFHQNFKGDALQTKYYFENLQKFIARLREDRVVGWQTYYDFIEARFSQREGIVSLFLDNCDLLLAIREKAEHRILWLEANSQREGIMRLQGQLSNSSRLMLSLTIIILAATAANMLPMLFGTTGVFGSFLVFLSLVACAVCASVGFGLRRVCNWLLRSGIKKPS